MYDEELDAPRPVVRHEAETRHEGDHEEEKNSEGEPEPIHELIAVACKPVGDAGGWAAVRGDKGIATSRSRR